MKEKRKDGQYIPLCWEGKPLAFYVKGHIETSEACETVARNEGADHTTLYGTHKYARFVFRQEGTPDGCDHTLKVYPHPGRGLFKVTEVKSTVDWHRAYMDRLIEAGGLTESEAKEALEAGMADFDYSDDPGDAATEEMTYWTD